MEKLWSKSRPAISVIRILMITLCVGACGTSGSEKAPDEVSVEATTQMTTVQSEFANTQTSFEAVSNTEKEKAMILRINETEVPVMWEANESVQEIEKFAKDGITISMSKYGGFEQVGAIGKNIIRNDVQMTTSPGDIVLYAGNQIVVFYGSNTWAYTKLGKINLPEDELSALLGAGDVTITIIMD